MTSPRLLFWDLENSPGLGYFWGQTWKTDIIKVLESARVMSFAAKWRGDPKSKTIYQSTHHDADGNFLPDGSGRIDMLARIAELMDEADALISYNGTGHDTPHITTEFVREGIPLPSPSKEIDLLKVTRSKLKLHSNRLQSVLHEFDLGSKVSHEGFPLWLNCMAGDEKAWRRFRAYNIGDVVELEKVYDLYLPLIPQAMHPNWALYADDGDVCPKCGSAEVQKRGVSRTTLGAYQRYQCQACGQWSRAGRAIQAGGLRGAS